MGRAPRSMCARCIAGRAAACDDGDDVNDGDCADDGDDCEHGGNVWGPGHWGIYGI